MASLEGLRKTFRKERVKVLPKKRGILASTVFRGSCTEMAPWKRRSCRRASRTLSHWPRRTGMAAAARGTSITLS